MNILAAMPQQKLTLLPCVMVKVSRVQAHHVQWRRFIVYDPTQTIADPSHVYVKRAKARGNTFSLSPGISEFEFSVWG